MTRLTSPFIAAVAAAFSAAGGPAAGVAAARPELDARERAVIRHINSFRSRHGLARVRPSVPLSRAADRHSRDMLVRDFFAHHSSDGTPFDHRVRAFAGPRTVGETLAVVPHGRGGAAKAVRMWRHSAPHRAVLLAGGFRRIGVSRRQGVLAGSRLAVFTADFASAR